MIVAIINQTSPSGQVRVEEFAKAADTAEAVAAYVKSYNPPLDPADWLGVDTGWTDFVYPAPNFAWAYDFGVRVLVQVSLVPDDEKTTRGALVIELFYPTLAQLPNPPPQPGLVAIVDDAGGGVAALVVSTKAGVWKRVALP